MATAMQQPYSGGSGYVARSSSSGLYDVLELSLDKGLVIDIFVRVSLTGIETEAQGLPELMDGLTEGGASKEALFGDEEEGEPATTPRAPVAAAKKSS